MGSVGHDPKHDLDQRERPGTGVGRDHLATFHHELDQTIHHGRWLRHAVSRLELPLA